MLLAFIKSAVLSVGLVSLGLSLLVVWSNPSLEIHPTPESIVPSLTPRLNRIAAFIEAGPTYRPTLQAFLKDDFFALPSPAYAPHPPVNFDIASNREATLAVVAPEGTVLAQAGTTPERNQILQQHIKMSGTKPLTKVAVIPAGRFRVIEAPIYSPRKQWLGNYLMVLEVPLFQAQGNQWLALSFLAFAIFLVSFIPLALFSLFLLFVFGFFASHVMGGVFARQLNDLTNALRGWTMGDFSHNVPEGRDEFGQLGRYLNVLRQELSGLVAAREQIGALQARHQLARDLHDTVKQELFAVSLQVDAARDLWQVDPQEARHCLDAADRLARQLHRDMNQIVAELYTTKGNPSQRMQITFAEALQELAYNWQTRYRSPEIRVTAEVSLSPSEAHIADLLHIAREALSNAVRHSGAEQIRVTWAKISEQEAILQVTDNGHGFVFAPESERTSGKLTSNVNLSEGGHGLLTMQERCANLSGSRLTVETAPGNGTTVCVKYALLRGNHVDA